MGELIEEENIFTSLNSLLWISRPLGFGPFVIAESGQWRTQKFLTCWNFILILLVSTLTCILLYQVNQNNPWDKNPLIYTVDVIIYTLINSSAIISLLNFTFRRDRYISALIYIDEIDKQLKELGGHVPHNLIHRHFWKCFIIGTILKTIVWTFLFLTISTNDFITIFSCFLSSIIVFISNLCILIIIYVIASRYETINNTLWNMRSQLDSAPIKKFAHLYNNVGQITSDLSQVFGLNQLITLGSYFIFSAMMTFLSVDKLLDWHLNKIPKLKHEKTLEIIVFCKNVILTFIILFYILCLGNVSYAMSKQAKRLALIIHDLANESQNKETRSKLIRFSKQLLDQEPNFSAAGFFSLDRPFCHSFVTGLTTILVIMIQISLSKDSNK